MPTRFSALAGSLLVSLPLLFLAASGSAQETWQRGYPARDDAYRPEAAAPRYDPPPTASPGNDPYGPRTSSTTPDDAYRPPRAPNDAYSPPPSRPAYSQAPGPYGQPYPAQQPAPGYGQPYSGPPSGPAYGQPYSPPPRQTYGEPYTPAPGQASNDPPYRGYGPPSSERAYGPPPGPGPRYDDDVPDGSYSSREILQAGHGFFGSVSKGLASVVEYAFQQQGRPNGYILGQDAGGAFVAGLRYGEGMLYTKDAGTHRIYWQGPSIGYDAGAEGSKVMVLVYNLSDPEDIHQRFGGVDGSAYLVGGVGLTFLKNGPIIVAPIRSGVGLRFGANIGYLKYTRRPTWNPF
jgi:hypothetical protein